MTTVGGTSSTAAKPKMPAGVPRPEIPTVVVGERLTKPHPAVQVLVKLLRDAAPDKYGALVITGAGGPAFRTSQAFATERSEYSTPCSKRSKLGGTGPMQPSRSRRATTGDTLA
jgi:hypothetical protein